jgi:WD40 repeat protein
LPGVPKVFGGVASGSFTHAAISPDDRWLAVTGTPGLFVWDLQSDGAEPRRLGCDAEGPDRIRFEPDGAVLASIRMTDMFSGLEVCAWDLNDLDTPPASARIGLEWPMDLEMQGGSILVLGKDGLIRLWPCMLDVDPKTCGEGVPVLILGRDFERKEGCAEERFSECAVWWRLALSSRWLASAGFNGTIQLYSVDSLGREPRILPPEDALVARGVLKRDDEYRYEPFNPAFSSQSTRVVQVPVVMLNGDASVATVIDDEGTIRTWRLSGSDRSPLHEERLGLDAGFPGYVQLGMVQPNNKNMFAVCARSGLLSVWRVSDSRPALVGAHGLGQCTPFSSVALSDSGKRVALARDSGAVEILDPIAGRLVERRAVPAELGRVVALRFAADGDTLIAVFVSDRGGGTVALWPGNRRGSGPNVIARSKNALHGLASSGDGTWLAVAEDGVGLRVWRASEPFAKASLLKEYGGSGAKFEFSRDGRTLALVEDRTFALWEPERGGAPLVLALPEVGWSSGIGFSRDGRYVGVGVEDGGAVIWRTRLEDLVSEACRAAGRDLTGDEWSSFFGDVTRRPVCRSSSAAVRPSPASAPRARR